jgi:hypothetical protein
MLAKGAMSAGRMPSMGMSKMSRAMNSPVKDYEVPDYSTSNPYSQYRFDTGLSKIPYGKKKFMSDEGGEDSLTITNEEFVRIFKNKPVVKMSACKKYIMIENTIYSTKTGKKISNTLLIENLLVEAWNLLDYAQAIVSVVSIFLPFVGNGTLFVNGIIYLYRGYTTKDDPNASSERIFNGILDLISAILPQVLGPACQYIKGALKLGTIGTRVINSIKIILNGLAEFGGTVIKAFGKFVGLRLVRAIIGKANAEAFEIWLRAAYESVKKRLQGFLAKNAGKAGAEGAEAAAKALTKAEILATKEGFETFFTKGVVKVAPKQASELLAKLNFKVGQTVTHKGKTWIINTISPKTNLVTLKDVAGKGFENVGATDFVNQVVKSPWFKGWATKKLANASAYAAKYNTIGKGASFLGVRFLAGFTFGADGNATIDMSKIPDGEYPDMSAANVDVEFEGGEYGGDTGQYTANDQVTAVQTALQALGENLGGAGVDGKYGPDTRGAINAVEDKVGVPKTTGNITFKSVIAIIIALVQKGKIAEAKELAAAIQDSEIKNNVDMILNSSTFTNPIKMGMLKALVSGKKPSTEKTSFMPDFMKNITGASTVAEETFSESYKRMFGLTLD